MSRTTTPPNQEGAYWYWHDILAHPEDHMLLWVGRCCDDGQWVAMECPEGMAAQYVADLPGTWDGPLQPQSERDFAPYRDALAAVAHESWSGWMAYLFAISSQQLDGTVTIPEWAVARWRRQMHTPYAELPLAEQLSDLDEADAIIACLSQQKEHRCS